MEWQLSLLFGGVVIVLFLFMMGGRRSGIGGAAIGLTGIILGLAIFIGGGLMFETPSPGNDYLLKVKDGKVVESKRTITMDWDNPASYQSGVQSFEGHLRFDWLKYKIYYRVRDDHGVEVMQRYYNRVVRENGNNLDIVAEKTETAIQKRFGSHDFQALQKVTKCEVMQAAEEYLEGYGIKVVGVE